MIGLRADMSIQRIKLKYGYNQDDKHVYADTTVAEPRLLENTSDVQVRRATIVSFLLTPILNGENPRY